MTPQKYLTERPSLFYALKDPGHVCFDCKKGQFKEGDTFVLVPPDWAKSCGHAIEEVKVVVIFLWDTCSAFDSATVGREDCELWQSLQRTRAELSNVGT